MRNQTSELPLSEPPPGGRGARRLCLDGIHQYAHLILHRLHLRPNDHLQIMLVELNDANGAVGLQRGGVDFAHVAYRQTQAGNAVIQRGDVFCAAQRGKDRRHIIAGLPDATGRGFLKRGAIFAIAARRFEVKAGDGEAEDAVVHREPDGGDDRNQVPLRRETVQDAKDHEINDVAVGIH